MKPRDVSLRDGMFQAHLLQGGSGEPLLFLHGAGGLHEGEYLDQLAERFHVSAPCPPGFRPSDGRHPIADITDRPTSRGA